MYKRPLSVYSTQTLETLEYGLSLFEDIKIMEGNSERRNIYFVEGFRWTIRSILKIWDDLRKSDVKYLLTGHINQDCLEIFFSIIRNKGGYNPSPTCRQFRIALQHNINVRLMKAVESSNCELQEAENLDVRSSSEPDAMDKENKDPQPTVSTNVCITEEEEQSEEIEIANSENDTSILESCSNVYVAGYLVHSLLKKIPCDECSSNLCKGNETLNDDELFIFHKEYEKISNEEGIRYLQRPSDNFAKLIKECLQKFVETFAEYKINKNIGTHIEGKLKLIFNRYNMWTLNCNDHKNHVIKVIIKMMMMRYTKFLIDNVSSNRRKLNILSSL